jgi:superfamily I DNA/RNA helicase
MKLTQEQIDIIQSSGNIRINAVAGSGKTTTVIEYAKARPRDKTILYLAFNKSVKLEAARKFAEQGLSNVRVETAHSLAYSHVVYRSGLKVRSQGYQTAELVDLLRIKSAGESLSEYVIANHVNKFVSYFCNSSKRNLEELNYADVVIDRKAREFVKINYKAILKKTQQFLQLMSEGKIEITHDFYLKKFQLSEPRLKFDYILFDEGQDASPAMLDVFLKQSATKVIVGDTHQQIYGWRFAVNSLEKVDFRNYYLSSSFRFGNDIALLSSEVLKWKKHLDAFKHVTVRGLGKMGPIKSKAVLARTNLALLMKAIEYVREKKDMKSLYFEGNFSSYTYADEGASLYDVLNLHLGKSHLIRDMLIARMTSIEELSEYSDKTEDKQLSMMIDIVKKYGEEIPEILKEIKRKHVENEQRSRADVIFSTVHRCKGMEYDSVELVDDFTNEVTLLINPIPKDEEFRRELQMEEVNLLYVAVTRARMHLRIPESLLPVGFPESNCIEVLPSKKSEEETKKLESKAQKYTQTIIAKPQETTKTYSVPEIRKRFAEAYQPWTTELDDELTSLFCTGSSLKEMAEKLGRSQGSIRARIMHLELFELYGF